MPLTPTTLGYALAHIYDFDFWATIYLPMKEQFESDTPVIVASPSNLGEGEEDSLHLECLSKGFTNWLNVAVVSDICDGVTGETEDAFLAAFNEDCREGGCLRKMMNYRN